MSTFEEYGAFNTLLYLDYDIIIFPVGNVIARRWNP